MPYASQAQPCAPMHRLSADYGNQPRNRLLQAVLGRKQTPDYLKPEEVVRTNPVEVSGFTDSGSRADPGHAEWQR